MMRHKARKNLQTNQQSSRSNAGTLQKHVSDVENASFQFEDNRQETQQTLQQQSLISGKKAPQKPIVQRNDVVQRGRKPLRLDDPRYFLPKLIRRYRLLKKAEGLASERKIRIDYKDHESLYLLKEQIAKAVFYLDKMKSSRKLLDSEHRQKYTKLQIRSSILYNKLTRDFRKKQMEEREERQTWTNQFEGFRMRMSVGDWYDSIFSENKVVLQIIKRDSSAFGGLVKHPWFLMDYNDIIDSQAQEADRVIATTVQISSKNPFANESFIAKAVQTQVGKYDENYLPMVNIHGAGKGRLGDKDGYFVNYSINPSYKKFVNTSGDEAVQILGESTDDRYKTDIRFIPGSLKVGDVTSQVGKNMEAKVLSQDHPIGSVAGKDSAQDKLMDNLCKTMGSKKTKYIKGHLLNDHVGGPARPYNLFPITDQANNDHLIFIEKYVKAEVEKGYVMYYKVMVNNVSVTDEIPTKSNHLRRYKVKSDLNCESAKLKPDGSKTEIHQITVKSDWGSQKVLDSTGAKIRRGSDTSTDGTELTSHSDFTRKMKTGTAPNEGGVNPDVKAPTSGTHRTYNKSGYNQDKMHKGKLSQSDITSTITGTLPFSISGGSSSGAKQPISGAIEKSVATVIGKHRARLIWTSSFIDSSTSKLKTDITKTKLLSITGIGPKSVAALEKEFQIS